MSFPPSQSNAFIPPGGRALRSKWLPETEIVHFFYTGRLIYDDCRLQLSPLRQTELCLDWSICSSESGAQTVRLQVIAALKTKINTLVKLGGSGKKHSEQLNRRDKLRSTGPTDSQDSVWHICGLKEINYIQNSPLFRGSFQGFDSSRSKVWVLMKNWKKLKWFPGLRRRALPHSSLGGTASQDSVSHLTTCCRWIHPPVAAAAAAAETPTR